ncbi:MAG: N-acetylmuramoyl-L-alanine amidase family protein [Candidatus Rifleibacteriota bacterium]
MNRFDYSLVISLLSVYFVFLGLASDIRAENKAKPAIIAIDPGHPSETSRGCIHHGLTELDICWQTALELEKLIAAEPGFKAIKTKNEVNTLVTNRERAEIANNASAIVLIRLHCDSGIGSGCTLYYPDKPGTVQGVTGPSEDVMLASGKAARYLQEGLAETLENRLKLNPIKTDSDTFVGSKQGALTGSIFAKVPAVVVEMVYLNNASDAAFIKETANQQLLAKGLLAGVKKLLKAGQNKE